MSERVKRASEWSIGVFSAAHGDAPFIAAVLR
jgi:hypothetical protein